MVLISTLAAAQLQTKDGLILKPRIGFGVGTLMFRGDVGGDSRGYTPLTADAGFSASASQEITPYLELELQTIIGRVSINEMNTDRRYNFRSSVHSLSLNGVYNFSHFLPKTRLVEPWVSLGFGSLEYLSKSDLKDANGHYYHYWTDGSIRNLAQSDPGAANAITLERDYVYETDLRDLNADGLGKYPDRTWFVPAGAGFTMHISERFRMKGGTAMHFTFTDLVDNVSDAGIGERAGKKNSDKFLFTSVGISYDLHFTPKNQPIPPELMDENGEMYTAWLSQDMDEDGVNDFEDLSAGTPPGAKVDRFGVPIDSDGDGFRDYADLEPFSTDLSTIDITGEAKGDDWVQFRYGAWIDSLRWSTYFGDSHMRRDFKRINGSNGYNPKQRYYDVFFAKDEDINTQDEIDALLSVKDLRSEKVGSETRYSAGQFDELAEAVQRKIELEDMGIDGRVELTTPLKRIDMTAVANVIAAELREEAKANVPNITSSDTGQNAPPTSEQNGTVGTNANPVNTGQSIAQNGTGSPSQSSVGNNEGSNTQTTISQNQNIAQNTNSVGSNTGNNSQSNGSNTQGTESNNQNQSTNSQGQNTNSIAKEENNTQGGTQIPQGEGSGTVGSSSALTNASEETGVFYRVQLGAFRKPLSESMFAGINGVIAVKGADGLTRYTVGSFDNLQDAAKKKIEMQLAGFEDAFITSYKGKKRIEVEAAPTQAPLSQTALEGSNNQTGSAAQVTGSTPASTNAAPATVKDPETSYVNSDKIRFTVLLGTFSSQIPSETLDKYLALGGVKPVRNPSLGVTSYIKGDFATAEEAAEVLNELRAAGFGGAAVSGKFNEKIISVEEAKRLKNPGQ